MTGRLLRIALVLALAAPCGCDDEKSPPSSVPPPPNAKPGFLIGKLSGPRGEPLRDVTVSIYGFSTANEPVNKQEFIAGPVSEYVIKLPDGIYSTPTATIAVSYNERTYVLNLAPGDDLREWPQNRDSQRGLVRDFSWKIAGAKPPSMAEPNVPAGYWGGTIHFDKQGDLGESATIKVTLTPDGPLMDGSQGQVLEYKRTVPWKRPQDHYLFDVPLGRYVATAQLEYTTKPRPLRIVSYNIDPENPELTPEKTSNKTSVEFEPDPGKGEQRVRTPNLVVFPPK